MTGPFSPYKRNHTPPFPQGSHIQLFVKLVEKDLQTLWEKRGVRNKHFNLTYADWTALQEQWLIIKSADKRVNIVLMERAHYLKMCL